MVRLIVLGFICCLAIGCTESVDVPPSYDARRLRRVVPPPAAQMRAVPPHAVHSNGIGPYTLGTPLQEIVRLLGPRVAILELDGVVNYRLVREEEGALLIGVDRPVGVTFVSVLDPEIARTESGAKVGNAAEVTAALGKQIYHVAGTRDPRLLVFKALPNTRFVLDRGRKTVAAIVVGIGARNAAVPKRDKPKNGDKAGEKGTRCRVALPKWLPPLAAIQAARFGGAPSRHRVVYGCLLGQATQAVVYQNDRLAIIGGEAGKLRRIGIHDISGIRFVGVLDIDGDSIQEIAVVSQDRVGEYQRVSLTLLRAEPTRLVPILNRIVYTISLTRAGWIGARLEQIELLLELQAINDSIWIHGLYYQHSENRPVNVAPLTGKAIAIPRVRQSQQSPLK